MTRLLLMNNIIHQFSGSDFQLEKITITLIIVMLAAALVCFLVSELTRNYSQVDKLWSLMPVVYSLITLTAFPSPRLLVMSLLVIIWGVRLTSNFARKGGYNIIPWKGEEDYRWGVMRKNPALQGRIRFGLFNLFFISFYQHFLILLFSMPLLIAAKNRDSDLTLVDIIAASSMLLFIIIETIADNQLFTFRKLKREAEAKGEPLSGSFEKGFITNGLWRFVRHPNFVSEQAVWISFYFFGVAATGKLFNWTLTGAILLVLLFTGSTALTERLSNEKYPGYADYSKEVPRFFPRIFRRKSQKVKHS